MKLQLQKLIANAQKRTRSQHDFVVFFKFDRNIDKIVRTFEFLIDVYFIIVNEERVSRTIKHFRTSQSMLMCINENDDRIATTMKICIIDSLTTSLIISFDKKIMTICFDFFNIKLYSKKAFACFKLENEKFKHFDVFLMKNLYAYVVYVLITMYNRDLYEFYYDFVYLRNMQYAVNLNVKNNVLNEINYDFYIDDKLLILHLFR